jgi:DMSO/TMAO reductase YedYZ heme-binding membrane subunit
MEASKARRGKGTLTLIILLPLVLVAAVLVATPSDYTLYTAIRGAAMLGYIYVFLTCLSSAFVLELSTYFGRPYIRTHHLVAVMGLTLLTIHGLAVAWDSQSAAVALPRFESAEGFLMWGGPPAYWLIWIAVVAAALRMSLGARWRMLHWLNYLAFLLATAHALMIGSDFERPLLRWGATGMALVVIAVFFRKRLAEARR